MWRFAVHLDNGLKTLENGGTVEVVPTDNPLILDMFRLGEIDGAWVPEPWASRLIVEGGGDLVLDERDLWTETNGEFVTAHIIVSTKFLSEHPDLVKAWIRLTSRSRVGARDHPAEAQALLNTKIEKTDRQKLAAKCFRWRGTDAAVTWIRFRLRCSRRRNPRSGGISEGRTGPMGSTIYRC